MSLYIVRKSISALPGKQTNWEFAEGSAPRTTLSFRTSAHTGVGIPIEFRAIYRHPFVGDGFPVPRNSETCLGRDGKPVPYDAFTVGPTNSNFSNRRIASAGMLYYRRIFRNCQTGKGGRSVIYFALPTIRTYFSPGQSNAPFTFYSVCYFTVSHKGSISQSVQNGSFHFSQSCHFTRSDGPWWWEGTGPHPPGRRPCNFFRILEG